MLAQFIKLALSNFSITFLIIAAIATALSVVRHGRGHLWEAALAYYCLFGIGFSFLYNFVMHVFFGATTAAFIGWADSPFQAEVGWASLGFAVVGFLAFRRGFEMRLAAIAGPAVFSWGAAIGHAYQMIASHISRRAMPASFSGSISSGRCSDSSCSGCVIANQRKPRPVRRSAHRRRVTARIWH